MAPEDQFSLSPESCSQPLHISQCTLTLSFCTGQSLIGRQIFKGPQVDVTWLATIQLLSFYFLARSGAWRPVWRLGPCQVHGLETSLEAKGVLGLQLGDQPGGQGHARSEAWRLGACQVCSLETSLEVRGGLGLQLGDQLGGQGHARSVA